MLNLRIKPDNMFTIDIAIATWKDRIYMVEKMLLAPIEGVRYVVSWQEHGGRALPEGIRNRLSRGCGGEDGDVEVYRFDLKGGSRNRNNAIDHCRGDVVVMSDDDLIYSKEGLSNVRKAFEGNPDMDLAVFMVDFPHPKPYPLYECRLGIPLPKGYWASMVEVAFRRERIGDLHCHPQLGLGAEYFQSGEDEMFVFSAIKRGLNCRFVNKKLCSHPGVSTGDKATPGILRGQGAIMGIMYPRSAAIRIILKAWRLDRAGIARFLMAFKQLSIGLISKNRLLDCPRCYRW